MEKQKFYLVAADALPEVFLRVAEAKRMLQVGEAATVGDAARQVGISRSAFYKYKDAVQPFQNMHAGHIITFYALLKDNPGVLSNYLSIFANSGANILTINQTIPTNGCAGVTISAETGDMSEELDDLMTRAAAAEHDDVIRRFHIFNGRLLHRDGLERFHVAARLRHAVRNGGQDGVGGVGRAGHSIHREGLVFHNGGRDLRDRTIGQAGGLAVLNDGHVGDRVRAERHRDGHRAVVALRSSGVSALGVSQRHRAGHHHHEEHQKGCCELFHGYFSFFFAILRKIILEIPILYVLNRLYPLYGLSYAQFTTEVILSIVAVTVLVRLFTRKYLFHRERSV